MHVCTGMTSQSCRLPDLAEYEICAGGYEAAKVNANFASTVSSREQTLWKTSGCSSFGKN